MTRLHHQADPPQAPATQLSLTLTTRRVLDAEQRAAVVALLSRLLLQVASVPREEEVDDDRA
jgi:hypothetical protein